MNYKFSLFIAGNSALGERAKRNLTQICEKTIPGDYELEIIDIMKETRLARKRKILACPTIIREAPEPEMRLIGDLSDFSKAEILTAVSEGPSQGL